MRAIFAVAVLAGLAACNSDEDDQAAQPINTNPIHFPATNGGPAQLNAAFANGDCHVRVDLISTGGGFFMSDTANPDTDFMLLDHQMVSPYVGDFYQQFWGREGEWSSCAQVPDPNKIPILLSELNDILTTNGQMSPGRIDILP